MPDTRRTAAGLLALAAALAFGLVYVSYGLQTLDATTEKPYTPDGGFVFVAIGIAGIVTSALAAWFGVTFPTQQTLRGGIEQLGTRLVPGDDTIKAVVGWIFFLVYFGVAALAGYVWWKQGSTLTPQVLKDLVAFAAGAATVIVAKVFA